ncbi:hypothetical protein C8J43_10665 [Sphingomonas sp. PP-CE-1G-424]|nr:hypothetical protein C8J43_10665 [Sphingomonas sp. PP-CE-1G-424]
MNNLTLRNAVMAECSAVTVAALGARLVAL